jgi:hypothetical protein
MKRSQLQVIAGLFLLLSFESSGQPPLRWQKCYGGSGIDLPISVFVCSDNGFVTAGYTESIDGDVTGSHGPSDYWIVRTTDEGILQWKNCYGGSGFDVGTSVIQTSDGGFVICGCSGSNDGDVTVNHGSNDIWVLRVDASGNIQWQSSFGGTLIEGTSFSGAGGEFVAMIQSCSDGGFLIGTNTDSNDGDVSGNHGSNDFWLIKIDSLGLVVWQKCYGGSASEDLTDIKTTSDGGFIMCGVTSSTDGDVIGDTTNGCSWIVKTDSLGQIEWQQVLAGYDSSITVGGVVQTSDGNYLVAGTMYNYGAHSYFAVVKLDSTGSITTIKRFWTPTSDEYCFAIYNTPINGGYVLCGNQYTSGNYNLKINNALYPEWNMNYGGSGYISEVKECPDSGFILMYSADNLFTCFPGNPDYRLLKFGGNPTAIKEEITTTKNFSVNFISQNTLNLSFTSEKSSASELKLLDVLGHELFKIKFSIVPGKNEKQLTINNIPKGIYILQLNQGSYSESKKLIQNF